MKHFAKACHCIPVHIVHWNTYSTMYLCILRTINWTELTVGWLQCSPLKVRWWSVSGICQEPKISSNQSQSHSAGWCYPPEWQKTNKKNPTQTRIENILTKGHLKVFKILGFISETFDFSSRSFKKKLLSVIFWDEVSTSWQTEDTKSHQRERKHFSIPRSSTTAQTWTFLILTQCQCNYPFPGIVINTIKYICL